MEMLGRGFVFVVGLMIMGSGMDANATPCLNFDPDHPNAHRAPAWAVEIMARHDGGILGVPVSSSNPMWQHGECDSARHEIKWCLPGIDCWTVK
jgi:hypothetical protein